MTLRLADPADGAALDRLAQRDCRLLPPGPHLVAEREGRIEAAVSLASGELLRCHAGEVRVRPEPYTAAPLRPRERLVPA